MTLRPSLRRLLAVALCAAVLPLAGCLMRPDFSVKVTTGEGIEMEVPLGQLPSAVGDDLIQVGRFRFAPWKMPDGVLGIAYDVDLVFKKGAVPTSVALDDVSDVPILTIFKEPAPKLGASNHWFLISPAYNPHDEHANWVLTLDNGVRVYRVTVTLRDGSVHVLRIPIFVAAGTKAVMRTQLGIN